MTTPAAPKFLSVKAAAAALAMSPKRVRALIELGELAALPTHGPHGRLHALNVYAWSVDAYERRNRVGRGAA